MSSVLLMPGTGMGPVSCDLVIAGEVFFLSFFFFFFCCHGLPAFDRPVLRHTILWREVDVSHSERLLEFVSSVGHWGMYL